MCVHIPERCCLEVEVVEIIVREPIRESVLWTQHGQHHGVGHPFFYRSSAVLHARRGSCLAQERAHDVSSHQWLSLAGPVDDQFEIARCFRLALWMICFAPPVSPVVPTYSGSYLVEEIAGHYWPESVSVTQPKCDRVLRSLVRVVTQARSTQWVSELVVGIP